MECAFDLLKCSWLRLLKMIEESTDQDQVMMMMMTMTIMVQDAEGHSKKSQTSNHGLSLNLWNKTTFMHYSLCLVGVYTNFCNIILIDALVLYFLLVGVWVSFFGNCIHWTSFWGESMEKGGRQINRQMTLPNYH